MKRHTITKLTCVTMLSVLFFKADLVEANMVKNVNGLNQKASLESLNDSYYQIKSKSIRELTSEEALEFELLDLTNDFIIPNIPPVPPVSSKEDFVSTKAFAPGIEATGSLDTIILVVDKLIAIGQKIIPIIKAGSAVVTNNPMAAVSVLPRFDSKDPAMHEMGGWSVPVSKHYKVTYVNGFGSEVVSFVYSVSFQHSGSVDGKGKYLAGIRASAKNITISWGFDLDASSQLIQISNVGTQQNVIAGATIEMNYTVKNWAKNITSSESFYVTGDGKLYKLD